MPATESARTSFDITKIAASFSDPDRATTYSVIPLDEAANAKISYEWTLDVTSNAAKVDPAKGLDTNCNEHSATDQQKFVWAHGNTGDAVHDDGCNHDLQGKWGHQGLITVVVKDGLGNQCTTTYKGSFATDANAALGQDPTGDVQCTTAGTSPPPPPPKCKCLLLTARVVPSSLKIEVPQNFSNGKYYDADWRRFTFTIHWVLNCSKGTGGCSGHLSAKEPGRGKTLSFDWHRQKETRDPSIAPIQCSGKCAELHDGGRALVMDGSPATGGDPTELNKLWRNASFTFLIKRTCQKRKLTSIKITIALDATGKKIDFKKSKLG